MINAIAAATMKPGSMLTAPSSSSRTSWSRSRSRRQVYGRFSLDRAIGWDDTLSGSVGASARLSQRLSSRSPSSGFPDNRRRSPPRRPSSYHARRRSCAVLRQLTDTRFPGAEPRLSPSSRVLDAAAGGTLAAQDITIHRGGTRSRRVSLASRPGSRSALSPERPRGDDVPARAHRPRAARRWRPGGLTRRSLRAGYLPQDRGGAPGRGRSRAVSAGGPAEAVDAWSSAGAPRPPALGGSGSPSSLDRRARWAFRRRAEPSGARLDLARALRRLPARRADERSRLPRARAAGALPARTPEGASCSSRTTGPCWTGRWNRSSSSSPARAVHHYTGGWANTSRAGARPHRARACLRAVERGARPVFDLHRDRREQARVGGKQASRRGHMR